MRGHVLDLGCGYGRLSKALLQDRPDITLTGLDASLRYSRMYGESVGAAVCADMAKLPFADAAFEGVMAVTSLMYATQRERGLVLREMARVLRPGGCLLLIDPGLEVQRLVALVRGKRAESPTGGSGFERDEYRKMTQAAGFDIEVAGGNLALSLLLLVPGVGSARGSFINRLLKNMARRDSRCDGYSTLAMHRWLLARRHVAP
jgi:SAM-dependent methyltransferase